MGKLYLIPTPIGNLEDITYRAVRILNEEVDLLLAEDTRISKRLLEHYGIELPMRPHHQKNEHRSVQEWGRVMEEEGKRIAYLTDAGMPGISDPGYLLVRAALEREQKVEALPGPTAFVPALVASGLPCERFVFEGFLPHKKGRRKRLKAMAEQDRSIVLYESPHRIERTLRELAEELGEEREASISRELTKVHEETIRGRLKELLEQVQANTMRGEFVIIVSPKQSKGA